MNFSGLSGSFSFVPPRTFYIPNFCPIPQRSYPLPEGARAVPVEKESIPKRNRKRPSKPAAVESSTFKENVPQKFVSLLQTLPTVLLYQAKRQCELDSNLTKKYNLLAMTKVGGVTKFVPLNKIVFPPPTSSISHASRPKMDMASNTRLNAFNEPIMKQHEPAFPSRLFQPDMDEAESERLVECNFSILRPSAKKTKQTKPKEPKKPQPRPINLNPKKKVAKRKDGICSSSKELVLKPQLLLPPGLCSMENMINYQTLTSLNESGRN